MTFGERLNQTRKQQGITAQGMADMLEVGRVHTAPMKAVTVNPALPT